jgi:hypothetical protein
MRVRCQECALGRSANLPDLEIGPDGRRAGTWAARIGRRLRLESGAIQALGPNRPYRQRSRQPTSLSPFLNDEFPRLRMERLDCTYPLRRSAQRDPVGDEAAESHGQYSGEVSVGRPFDLATIADLRYGGR